MGSRSGRMLAALVLVALLVNLPFAHQAWTGRQLDNSGVMVTAEVTDTEVLKADTDPHYLVQFRLPAEIDPAQQAYPVEVDAASYRTAQESEQIRVQVLTDRPATYRVEGQTSSNVGMLVLLSADALLLLLVAVLWWARRSGRLDGPGDDPEHDRPDQSRPF